MQKQPKPKPFSPARSTDARHMIDPRFHALAVNQEDRDPPSCNTTSSFFTDLRSQPSSLTSSLPISTSTLTGSSPSVSGHGEIPATCSDTPSAESLHERRKDLQRRRAELDYHESVMVHLSGCDEAYERAQTQALRSAQLAKKLYADAKIVERTERQLMLKVVELKKNRLRKALFPGKTGDAIDRMEQKLITVSYEALNARNNAARAEKQSKADTARAEALRHDAQRLQFSRRLRRNLLDCVNKDISDCGYGNVQQGDLEGFSYERAVGSVGERKTVDVTVGRGRRGCGMRKQLTGSEFRKERTHGGAYGFAPTRMATADGTELRKAALAAAADIGVEDVSEIKSNTSVREEELRSQVEALRLLVKARKYLHQVRKDIWGLMGNSGDSGLDAQSIASAAHQLKRGANLTRDAGRRIVSAVSLSARPLPVAALVEAWGVATTFLDLRDVLDIGTDASDVMIGSVVSKTVTLLDSVNDVVKESISIQTNSVEQARKRLTSGMTSSMVAKGKFVRRSNSFQDLSRLRLGEKNLLGKIDVTSAEGDAADEDDMRDTRRPVDMRAMSDLALTQGRAAKTGCVADVEYWQFVGGTGI